MNIISYNFEKVLKNRLKNKINDISNTFVDNLLNSFSNIEDNNNYLNIISESNNVSLEITKEVILEVIKEFDDYYRDSIERKRIYNINKRSLPRTITTIIGEITFNRTYYETKDRTEYYAYIDDLLNLPKNDHYDPIVKGLVVRESFYSNQAQAGRIVGERITNIKDLTNKDTKVYEIPRQSVNNWLKEWNVDIHYEKKDTPINLYIMADEKYIGSQDLDKDIMGKAFVIFEGIKEESKGRRKLINRHIITCYSDKPWEELLDRLCEIYNYDEIKNFYILSDGGKWITSGISELKVETFQEVEHFLCLFHLKQAINRITTNKDERIAIFESFLYNKRKVFKNVLNAIKSKYPERTEIIESKIKYIMNHYKAAKHMISSKIGSSMESHISHFVASQFSSRPKGYSSKYINKYFMLNDAKNNGINLFNTYLQTYNIKEEKILYNEKTNKTSAIKKETSYLPTIELPITNTSYSYAKEIILDLSRIDTEINC